MKKNGILEKMLVSVTPHVFYELELGDEKIAMNSLVGKRIKIKFTGNIFCLNCKKKTKKSYGQGFCFPCSMKLAQCDMCILKPELCHYSQGTCREPSWGEEHCLKPHIVYLANTSGLKVGITRKTQVPIRWMDQGATEALPILEVKDRLSSGLVEILFKKHIADKTDWRKMLRGSGESIDLKSERDRLLLELKNDLSSLSYTVLDEKIWTFEYPVSRYPEKVSSINLEKQPEVTDVLMGIKGQYLIFNSGVLNIRSHSGLEIILEEVHEK